jgi:T5orf172 domain
MSGHVYFIQAGAGGPIKIGFTRGSPAKRMHDLQCGCPWELRLLGSVPGKKLNEKWLQEKLSEFKMRREWFAPAVFAEVTEILTGPFAWPHLGLPPIDRAIALAGSQCDLSNKTGVAQPDISAARRSGKLPRRIREYLSLHEEFAA